MSKRISLMVALFCLGFIPAFTSAAIMQRGVSTIVRTHKVAILMGKVELGPRCPVEPCRVLLGARQMPSYDMKVRAYSIDRDPQTMQEAKVDRKGNYYMTLPPGKYILDIIPNPWQLKCLDLIGPCITMAGSIDVPREIVVKWGLNREDIHIDTGIRAIEQIE